MLPALPLRMVRHCMYRVRTRCCCCAFCCNIKPAVSSARPSDNCALWRRLCAARLPATRRTAPVLEPVRFWRNITRFVRVSDALPVPAAMTTRAIPMARALLPLVRAARRQPAHRPFTYALLRALRARTAHAHFVHATVRAARLAAMRTCRCCRLCAARLYRARRAYAAALPAW